jgi:branched-chain amino acid aminotransferase
MLRMQIPFKPAELVEAAKATVRLNRLASAYIRPLAFRGEGEMGLYPQRNPVRVAIAAWAWGPYLGEALTSGARVAVSSWRRNDPNIVLPEAKGSGQYVNSILAKIDAVDAGFDEAIMLNLAGQVAEGSGENLFLVRGGEIVTPPAAAGILMGITRDTVIRLARDLGYLVNERLISRSELYVADELFFTGTGAEITPIREVDGRIVGGGTRGPITERLQTTYFALVQGTISGYDGWLELVDA